MKLHLPCLLRRLLLASVGIAATVAEASILHPDVSIITYTDFGQNVGRYTVGDTNALLAHIRQQQGGVVITYVDGTHADFVLPHGMIDFSSQNDGGYGAAVGYSFFATVQHNGVFSGSYTGNSIGESNAIYYSGIEYRYSDAFLLTPSNDYKITRMSKLVTDVTTSVVYGQTTRDWSAISTGSIVGEMAYRAGSGVMEQANLDGSKNRICGAYVYITGAVMTINNGWNNYKEADGAFSVFFKLKYGHDGITEATPMPFASRSGDSGSPIWVWNAASGQFEYLTAIQSGNDKDGSQARGACKWTVETMESFDKAVDVTDTVRIFAAKTATGETITDKDGYTAKPYKGKVTDAAGNTLVEYIGVKTGINTWKDLSAVKDTDNWYHYGAEYLNADAALKVTGTTLTYADLQQTENLVFTARNANTNIIVEEDTDLGIGYVRLSKASGLSRASYTISGSHLLNSAGYIVDSGVDARLQLTNSANYMREWRAVVEDNATLHIEGAGDTNALLNVGGQGTVYLDRTSGYSAYNVLANNGVTVVINDIGQIKRDFTFGYQGGVLDMNGASMTWNNGNAASAAGFTIHALDEQAIVANRKAGTTTTLTWTQGGGQTWLGSFQDTADSALRFVYNGGGVLTMNSIHTKLQNAGSGIEVQSGKVVLSGTNTIHGKGSESGRNANRYFSAEDWHYADSAANVSVQNGGTFELGSHARLTGNVAVANGGSLIIREGVKHRYEYIEGGLVLEDTDDIRDFYGLKGNIVNNGTLSFSYSAGTDSTNIYAGAISGSGSMNIDLGTAGAKLVLSGANTMTGAHTVTSGGVVLKNAAALGTVTGANAWKIGEQAWLGVEGVTDSAALLSHIHADSTGSLALAGNLSNIGMSGHTGLFLGAEEGMKVQLGTLGTTDTLTAWHTADGHTQWLLGGGGGELVVNLKLTGNSDLVLGNEYMSGTVTLTNTANDFTGNIIFAEQGNVVLNFTDPRALGRATVDLAYGKALGGGTDAATTLTGTINEGAEGVMLLDDDTDAVLNMSARPTVHLGANGQNVSFTGNITVANNGTYYFGGPGELILQNALAANGVNAMVVDGEGFTGGAIVLNQATGITGAVTVMGYDASRNASRGISTGSMTLVLNTNDAIANAASVTVKDGGTLQIGTGTTQTVKNLQALTGGTVQGTGALHVQSGDLNGATVDIPVLVKTGDGNLDISNDDALYMNYLDVQGGSVTLQTDLTHVSWPVFLGDGTSLHVNGHTMGVDIGAVGNATLASDNKTANITGVIDVAAGKTLTVSGNNLTILGENEHLGSGGTLEVAGGTTLNLNVNAKEGIQYFGGTVKLNEGSVLANAAKAENLHYEFENLAINGNAQIQTVNWNSIVTVHSLTGEGQLLFLANSGHSKNNLLVLDGEGTFSGEVYLKRTQGHTNDSRRFNDIIEIAHDKALQNASVRLFGNGGWAYSALAINTDEAQILGLNGADETARRNAVIYAGSALTSAQSTTPQSTRNATLNLTGSGTYNYYGGVSGDAEHAISLLKTGTGTQTFADGSDDVATKTASFKDVTVMAGTLNLNNTTTNVYGDYGIGQGATLSVAGGVTLGSGHMLAALYTESASAATLGSALTLNGGSLGFSAKAMQEDPDHYLLALNGVSLGSGITGITVNFLDTNYLKEGTYKLASGNFAGLGLAASAYTTSDLGYYNAAFQVTSSGLSVTLSTAAGTFVWNGTDANHGWSYSQFSDKYISGTPTKFVFTDSAANKNISVSATATYSTAKAIFDADEDYTVTTNGGTVKVKDLEKKSAGDLDLVSGFGVTGSTTITEGRVLLHDNALKGTITGDGTLALASAGASLTGLTGNIGTLEVLENATYTLATGNSVTAGNVSINGGTVTVNETYAGQITAHSGTLGLANNAQASKLDVQGTTATVDVAAGATGKLGKATFGEESVSGEEDSLVVKAVLTKTGAGTLSLTDKTTQGNFVVQQGVLSLDSYDYQYLTGIDLRNGTKLVFNSKWTSIDHAKGADMTQLKLAGGSTIEMHNGANNTRVNADITVDATEKAAVIRGIDNGDQMHFEGDITGKGTLQLRALVDGTMNANSWAVNSTISNGTDGTLRLEISDVTLAIGGTSANTFSGGASVSNSEVTVNKATAFGAGKLELSDSTVTLNSDLSVGLLSGGADSTLAGQDGRTLVFTAASGSAAYSGAIGGMNVSVLKSGGSTQTLSNVSTLQDVAVAGGTLTLTGTQVALGGDVEVAQGANLTLGGALTLANPISNSGTVTFADGASFTLAAENFTDNRYYITTGSGSVSGLSLANFTISGLENVALSSTSGGPVYLYIDTATGALVWNGTAGGNVWGGRNWIAGANNSASFQTDDDVHFTSAAANKAVVVDNTGVQAGAMSISGTGYTFSGGGISATSLSMEEGVSATFGNALHAGSIELANGSGFSIANGTLDLRDGTGDVFTASGTPSVSITGSTVEVDSMRTMNTDLTLGTSTIHAASASDGLTLAEGKTVTWNGLITNDGGTLAFNGTIALDSAGTAEIYYDELAADSGNGYKFSQQLVQNTNGGSVTLGDNAAVTVGGAATSETLTANAGGLYLGDGSTLYYVNSGTLEYGDAGNSAASAATTGIVLNGGGMHMQQSLAETATAGVILQQNATVNIGEDATLKASQVTKNGHTLTIDGSGVFVNGSGPTLQATLANTWTGTVELSGTLDAIVFDNYGKGRNSTIRCAGVTGWIKVSNLAINENIELAQMSEGAALNLTGTSGKEGYAFKGDVSGAGNMSLSTGTSDDTFTFSGDVSNWTGALNHTNSSGATTLKFTKDGDTSLGMGGITHTGNGTLDVQVSGSGAKTVAGKLTSTTLTMNGSGTMGFTQQLAMENGKLVINSGEVTLDQHNAKTAQLKNTAVEVYGGGKLSIAHDSMGWKDNTSDTSSLKSILLQGESETNRAVLNNVDASGNNTFSATLTMAGHALVESTGSHTDLRVWHGMGVTATGTDNEISAGLIIDQNLTVTVGDATHPDSELKISGPIKKGGTNVLTKAGSGTLSLTGAVDVAGMDVQAGTLELSGAVTLSGAITNAGTVDFNGATFTVASDAFTNNRFNVVTGNGSTTGTLAASDFTVTGSTDPLRLIGMGTSSVYLYSGNGELTWDGVTTTGGDAWGNSNWTLDGDKTSFETGDTVHFTDTAVNKNVVVADAGVTAGAMDITASGYTFSGGSISATSLTLEEGVTATFRNALTVGNDIELNGGTLKFDTDGAYNVGMNMTGAGNVEISGTGAKTVAGKLTNTTLTMNGDDTLGFTQTLAMEGGKLVINSGEVTVDKASGGASQLKGTAVEVNGGGTLVVKHDSMGWSGNGIASILLQGESEDKRAILTSESNTGGTGSTSAAELTLAGHALVQSTGSQKIIKANGMSIAATGTDNEISSDIAAANALTIKVGDDDHPDSELLVSGDIKGQRAVTKTGSGKLTLTGSATNGSAFTVQEGTLALSGNGSIQKGNMTLSAAHEGEAAIQSATITTNSIAGQNGGGEMANMKALFENAKVTISDMVISADSSIGHDPATHAVVGTTEAAMGGSKLMLEQGQGKNATLSETTVAQAVTRNDGKPDISVGTALSLVDCTTFNVDVLSGTLTLDFTSLWGDILAQDTKYIAVDFSGVDHFAEGTTIHACANGWAPVEAVSYGSAGGHVVYFQISQIPEPATATLSILTLAGLLARRRRRAREIKSLRGAER